MIESDHLSMERKRYLVKNEEIWEPEEDTQLKIIYQERRQWKWWGERKKECFKVSNQKDKEKKEQCIKLIISLE
jgi:hypothetical protein